LFYTSYECIHCTKIQVMTIIHPYISFLYIVSLISFVKGEIINKACLQHIATMRLCSSHCDDKVMFITLRQHVCVHQVTIARLSSSHCNIRVMFDTLRRYYAWKIVTLLCSSHCNITMFTMLQHLILFIILQHRAMFMR
jgi:hypothetical protein